MATSPNELKLGDFVAPVAAVVALFGSVAVAGIIGQAQRNHGDSFALAFGLVIGGAAAWFLALLIAPPPASPDKAAKGWRFTKWVWENQGSAAKVFRLLRMNADVLLKMVGVGLMLAGILWGILTLVATQQDFERPAISASFAKDSSLLTATVTDEGLASGHRLAVLIQVLTKSEDQLTPDPDSLYFSVLGPGLDGKVKHSLEVYVPTTADLVRVKAWTGETDSGCTSFEEKGETVTTNLRHGEEAGCLVLRLPERATTANIQG